MTSSGALAEELPVTSRDGSMLAVRGLERYFPIRDGALQRVAGHVKAVDGVSFDLPRGETLGLVGESGCGKTTLGRVVSGLSDPTGGGVFFDVDGPTQSTLDDVLSVPVAERTEKQKADLETIERSHRIDRLQGAAWKQFRRNCQVVFQDSFASLNPRHLVRDIVGRPLRVQGEASGGDLTEKVVELLEQVGMGRQHLYRYPHQFSGGQRQRISIARALALDPELLILDEPTSALDVSVQAQILNLLHGLQEQRNLTYLFITHDLSVVRHMADRIVVMYVGKVAEAGPTNVIFDAPTHPYTRALLGASPDLEDDRSQFHGLEGSVPDPARPPEGCRFHTRCPVVTPVCGWEVDDVVLRLQDEPGLFDQVDGVEHRSPFDADLRFSDAEAARRLSGLIESQRVPAAMRDAIEEVTVNDRTVTLRFQPVDEVELTDRGPGHVAACVLGQSRPL
jgi:oligopeptide/dipeptide ABC transporter ATP-binding protein